MASGTQTKAGTAAHGDPASNGKVPDDPWPKPMDDAAFTGLAGDVVATIEPESEADRQALLMSYLVAAGNALGRGAYLSVGTNRHGPSVNCIVVGDTSQGAKGTSGIAMRPVELADPAWAKGCVKPALSTGEGLVFHLRDAVYADENEGTAEITDPGVTDKRLLVYEGEFVQTLKVMSKPGNTLAPQICTAYDGKPLGNLSKGQPNTATDYHLSILGHITDTALQHKLTDVDIASGFANRFVFVCSRLSKLIPSGGALRDKDLTHLANRTLEVINAAATVGELRRTPKAEALWEKHYAKLRQGQPGMFGEVIGRAAAMAARMSLLYALLDLSPQIKTRHVKAALAVWKYCEESAAYIWGDSLGHDLADKYVAALRHAQPEGLTETQLSKLSKTRTAAEQKQALALALKYGRAHGREQKTKGRPRTVWFAS